MKTVVELNGAQSIANTTRTLDEMCVDYASQVMQENRGSTRGSIAAKLGIGERTLRSIAVACGKGGNES